LSERPAHVLIAGVSARAAAESAARAGFQVTAIDAYADRDQHPGVEARSLAGEFSARAAARAAEGIACDAVAYLSSFENHRRAVAALAAGRSLWGNPPDVLRRVRDPFALAHALRARGFAVPATVSEPGTRNRKPRTGNREPEAWLAKPLSSGGGRRVRRWQPGARLPRGRYLQEFVAGTPASVVFVAAGGRSVPLAVSRQLAGDAAFGAKGYQYCGSILLTGRTHADALALSQAVAEEFGLVGVNGVDFIDRDGRAHAIEVNPRWSASMELVELAYGLSVFGAHAAACTRGELPAFDVAQAAGAIGKAIVFARRDVVVGDTTAWLSQSLPALPALPALRDIPRPGDRIAAGRPVCTVFARGGEEAECYAALEAGARDVYAVLARWEREAA